VTASNFYGNLQAENITAGTIAIARLPSVTNQHTHDVANLTNVQNLANTHTHDAANITTGNLNIGRMPTGGNWFYLLISMLAIDYSSTIRMVMWVLHNIAVKHIDSQRRFERNWHSLFS